MIEVASTYQLTNRPSAPVRLIGFSAAGILHVAAIAALVYYAPSPAPLAQVAAIMVSLIAPGAEPEKPVAHSVPRPPERSAPNRAPAPAKPANAPSAIAAPMNALTETSATAARGETTHGAAPMTMASAAPSVGSSAHPAPVAAIPPDFNAAYLDNPAPAYPPLSRRVGEQGQVMLRVHVTVNGAADQIELRTSSGSSRLDDAALTAVKRWRFVPARQGERAVDTWVLIPITFSLKG